MSWHQYSPLSSLRSSLIQSVRSESNLSPKDHSISSPSPSSSSSSQSNPNLPTHLAPSYLYDMDDFDRGDLSYWQAMVAGASAGVMEHIAMFPVDTAKTRMQAKGHLIAGSEAALAATKHTNVVSTLTNIAKVEGVPVLYRGVGAVVLSAIPSHSLYFATIEYFKETFGGNKGGLRPVENAMAGGIATLFHDSIVTPLDNVKQRLQVYNSPYRNIGHCARTIFRAEGWRGFYASYPITVLLNVPFMSVNFASYESFKYLLAGDGEHSTGQELLAGGAAGALGGLVSNPLDVVKTRIQTDPGNRRPKAMDVVRSIMKEEGLAGFMRGTTARVLYFMPSAAISWTTYDTMKKVLSALSKKEDE